MAELDFRVIKISIEINGRFKIYESPMAIIAAGTKYANALQNDCTVVIDNIDKETQDFLLTETSPYNFNKTPKTLIVEVGRENTGLATIFKGNIIYASVSQPPDVSMTLKCLTGNFLKGNVLSRNQPGMTTHKQICQQIAQDTNTILNYQATDKNISNYIFAGGALNQINVAGSLGDYNVFIDNDVLVVKDALVPLTGRSKILSDETGMIGVPEFSEQGIKVKFLLDNLTVLGGALDIRSNLYPAVNGIYVIYKLGFQIATRENPFYYIAEAARLPPRSQV